TIHLDFSMMQLNQMPHDGQPQSESALRARSRTVGLTETIENVREELRSNADARVGYVDSYLRIPAFGGDFDLSAFRRELDRIGKQVPEDLLQTIGIPQHAATRFHDGFQTDPFRGQRRMDRFDGRLDNR